MQRMAIEEFNIEQKSPGPGTPMVLRHWLGEAQEECGLSSDASADPESAPAGHWQLSTFLATCFFLEEKSEQCVYRWLRQEET